MGDKVEKNKSSDFHCCSVFLYLYIFLSPFFYTCLCSFVILQVIGLFVKNSPNVTHIGIGITYICFIIKIRFNHFVQLFAKISRDKTIFSKKGAYHFHDMPPIFQVSMIIVWHQMYLLRHMHPAILYFVTTKDSSITHFPVNQTDSNFLSKLFQPVHYLYYPLVFQYL